jgi:hypothetical protein
MIAGRRLRDGAATACPGTAVHATLPELRREVTALLRATG